MLHRARHGERRASGVAAALLMLALVTAPTARAQSPMKRAITLFNEARVHYNMGQYDMAADKLKAAIGVDPSIPGPYRNLGLAYRAMGKCDLALPYFRKYLELQPGGKHTERVRQEIAHCAQKVGVDGGTTGVGAAQIVIRCSERGAQVTIDGVLRGSTPANAFPVQPGKHTISVFRSGFLPWNGTVSVSEGQAAEVEVALARDTKVGAADPQTSGQLRPRSQKPGILKVLGIPRGATVSVDGRVVDLGDDDAVTVDPGQRRLGVTGRGFEPHRELVSVTSDRTTTVMLRLTVSQSSRSLRRWAWISTGLAAALGIAGGIVGLMENATFEEIRDYDRQAGTRSHLNDLLDERRGQALAANVLYGVAGAALAAGVVLFFLAPEVERAPETGQTRAMLRGGVRF